MRWLWAAGATGSEPSWYHRIQDRIATFLLHLLHCKHTYSNTHTHTHVHTHTYTHTHTRACATFVYMYSTYKFSPGSPSVSEWMNHNLHWVWPTIIHTIYHTMYHSAALRVCHMYNNVQWLQRFQCFNLTSNIKTLGQLDKTCQPLSYILVLTWLGIVLIFNVCCYVVFKLFYVQNSIVTTCT